MPINKRPASNKQQSGPSFDLRQDGFELSYSIFDTNTDYYRKNG